MGLPRKEDTSWSYLSDIPDVNGLINADCLRGKEDGNHVFIPCLYHLANFIKLINIGWEVNVSEPNFPSDGV